MLQGLSLRKSTPILLLGCETKCLGLKCLSLRRLRSQCKMSYWTQHWDCCAESDDIGCSKPDASWENKHISAGEGSSGDQKSEI